MIILIDGSDQQIALLFLLNDIHILNYYLFNVTEMGKIVFAFMALEYLGIAD